MYYILKKVLSNDLYLTLDYWISQKTLYDINCNPNVNNKWTVQCFSITIRMLNYKQI